LNVQARISVLCIPTGDTHITSDMCAGIHISRGYTYHCDTGLHGRMAERRGTHRELLVCTVTPSKIKIVKNRGHDR